MVVTTVIFYTKNNARSPVADDIRDMNNDDKAKVLACLKSVEELGLDSPRVVFRQIKGKLWEIKIRTKDNSYRIFYIVINKNTFVLLHIYKKQSQKAPAKELKLAEKRMMEVLKNETNYT